MEYREIAPSPSLARYVECFWILSGADLPGVPVAERILPDGCMELVLNLEQPFQRMRNNQWELQPQFFVVGQMTEPVLIAPSGRTFLIGIRFHPWGARPFMGMPLGELAGRILPLDQILCRFGQILEGRLGELPSTQQRISALEKILLGRLRGAPNVDVGVEAAARLALKKHGVVSVTALCEATGTSRRQFERKFSQEVGIGPKRFCRILRFQKVFRALEKSTGQEWAGVASECGYYDQSHLIRDFQEFAGETPASLPLLEGSLTSQFMRAHRMSHFSNTWD